MVLNFLFSSAVALANVFSECYIKSFLETHILLKNDSESQREHEFHCFLFVFFFFVKKEQGVAVLHLQNVYIKIKR